MTHLKEIIIFTKVQCCNLEDKFFTIEMTYISPLVNVVPLSATNSVIF